METRWHFDLTIFNTVESSQFSLTVTDIAFQCHLKSLFPRNHVLNCIPQDHGSLVKYGVGMWVASCHCACSQRRGKKALVLDPKLSGPLSLIAQTSLLKEHGVEK